MAVSSTLAVSIAADREAAAARAAEIVIARVRAKPRLTLGLATGATMEPLYRRLVAAHRTGLVDLAAVTTFNLDEYCGLPVGHPAAFAAFMRARLFGPIGLDPARTHLLDGGAEDADLECSRYEAAMAQAGGIDLQLLGLGRNGHIAFNEPGAGFASRTRRVDLAAGTRAANARAFASAADVPRSALTMGIGTILDAREILIVATGAAKGEAVAAALQGPVSRACPASALQIHAAAHFVLDREAAADLAPAPGRIAPALRPSPRDGFAPSAGRGIGS